MGRYETYATIYTDEDIDISCVSNDFDGIVNFVGKRIINGKARPVIRFKKEGTSYNVVNACLLACSINNLPVAAIDTYRCSNGGMISYFYDNESRVAVGRDQMSETEFLRTFSMEN